MKKNLKKIIPFSRSFIKVYRNYILYKRELKSKKIIKSLINNKDLIFVEFGSGDKEGKNGWKTVDVTKNCDIYWDLRKGLPFPEKSVSKIYSSHFLEHLSYNEGQLFLKGCLKILTPGGMFSICVPNAKIFIEAYLYSNEMDKTKFYKKGFNNTTGIDYINYIAYMDNQHKYMFDEDNLVCLLQSCGFIKVNLRKFDPSLDLESRDYESIYAVAYK